MPRSGVTRERSGVGGSVWGATLCDGASQATVEQGGATLLIAILRAHDDLRGTVIDLAGPVARAEQAIA
ncbi:MAG TPA: hypothetical protein VFC16_10230, partial [Nakamurella sp.]|nr:hypothetical protein [Nakamurella sp.]